MGTILRFNWPYYLAAGVVLLGAAAGLGSPVALLWKVACGAAVVGAGHFLLVSLGVSHLVYDRSDLYRFRWLDRALGNVPPDHVVFCHSGFDDLSEALRLRLQPTPTGVGVNAPLPVGRLPPGGDPATPAEGSGPTVVRRSPCWITLDHFDPKQMTEASIRRARRFCPPTAGTVSAPFDAWPVESSSADVVFGLLAIHEFRSEGERTRWFAEARRSLKPGGRVVLAEHLRDPANFLAFGPGFLHFHSAASWRRCWEAAGLRAHDEFKITPWIRVFVLISP